MTLGNRVVSAPKSQMQSLQVFRGLAALAVVAHHAALSTEAFVGEIPALLTTVFGFGLFGVDFFFVLSGFIIMYAHFDDGHTTSLAKRYAFKRLTRIYPAYWPIGLAMVALYALMPDFSASGGREISFTSSVLLLPANGAPALSVAWTLVHELIFYGVFLLFYVSRRFLFVGLALWALVILLANHNAVPTGWLRYPLNLLNLEFMLGVAAAWLIKSTVVRGAGRWFVLIGAAVSCMAFWLMVASGKAAELQLLLTLGLAFLIMGFAVVEQVTPLKWPALLLILGNASYSIYLIHNPFLSISQRLAGRVGLEWPSAMLLGVVSSVFVGWLYYLMVERRALRFFKTPPSSK